MSVLQLTEQGIDNDPGGVVNRQQQSELRSVFPKPSVVAAVYLYQHTLTRHTLTPNSVLWWTPSARAALAGAHQQATQCATRYVYAFAFTQQLAHMSVVGSRIPCARQIAAQRSSLLPMSHWALYDLDDRGRVRLLIPSCMPPVCAWYGVLLTPISVDACSIVHMPRQQTVEYLKPCLFSLVQYHIHHVLHVVTFMLNS